MALKLNWRMGLAIVAVPVLAGCSETAVLDALLGQGITPVVSPISLGVNATQIYNVNADAAAAAIASALRAPLTFISNVPGVLDAEGTLMPALTKQHTLTLIDQGVINGGMIPKVQAALQVLDQRVPEARIVNLAGLYRGGTLFHA